MYISITYIHHKLSKECIYLFESLIYLSRKLFCFLNNMSSMAYEHSPAPVFDGSRTLRGVLSSIGLVQYSLGTIEPPSSDGHTVGNMEMSSGSLLFISI